MLCFSCGLDYDSHEAGVEVALGVSGSSTDTRTSPNSEYNRFFWDKGDKVAVWAKAEDGTYSFENHTFRLLALTDTPSSVAWFTSTLPAAMAKGTYTYYMCYPLPESVSGTVAAFTVPSVQNGDLSGGSDITVAVPVQGSALGPIPEDGVVGDEVLVKMKHMLHFLRFYIPEGENILGEPVERIVLTMPQSVAGKLAVDVSDISNSTVTGGQSVIRIDLADSLEESTSSERHYAGVAILPAESVYSSSDSMQVKIISRNYYSVLTYSLDGRSFEPGHVTSVALRPEGLEEKYILDFVLASNNLGEDVRSLTLTLPSGVNWPGTESNVYVYAKSDGSVINVGDTFRLGTSEEEEFKALSSKSVTISYDSESALVSQTLTLGDLSGGKKVELSLDCPYLFFEDFSGVESFNSGDKHSNSNAGSKDPKVFDGWSVARAGAQAGTAIRLACHRETGFANYPARGDSPFLSGLKEGKTVSLDVQFNYSMGREEGGLGKKPEASQTVYLGYITTSDNLKSGDDTGTFPTSFTLNETTGSYTNINHLSQHTLTDVQAPIRLSWRTITETVWDTSNSTCWLYIDNVKVKISK